jgi:hypothetical protein
MSAIIDNPAGRNAGMGALANSPVQGAPISALLAAAAANRDAIEAELNAIPPGGSHRKTRECRRRERERLLNALLAADREVITLASVEHRCSTCLIDLSLPEAQAVEGYAGDCGPCSEVPF